MGVELLVGGLMAGTSLLGSKSQSKAIDNATQAQTASTANEIAAYERMFQQQRADYEPFRQYEIQQANAMGELFGFNPVGQPAAANSPTGLGGYAPPYSAPGGGNVYQPQQGGFATNRNNGFGVNALMAREDGNPAVSSISPGYNQNGMGQITLPGAPPVQNALDPNKMQTTAVQNTAPTGTQSAVPAANAGGVTPLFDSSLGGADRFNNSLFNPVAQNLFNTQRDNIDNNLAGQGAVYSSVRQNAIQQAGVNSTQSALGMYLNSLMGAPQMGATQGSANAAANYGNQVGNSYQNQGAYQAQSAYNQGQNNANMWNNLGSAGAFALGGM